MLWTAEDAAAIRERIENDPDARIQLENTLAISSSVSRSRVILVDLFRAVVLEDRGAVIGEMSSLVQSIGRKPEPLTWNVDPETLEWNEGMPSAGDRHMRDERTEDALRYDAFYHLLSENEKKGIEQYFHHYIQFQLDRHPPRHPHFAYDRTSWLPNMHWPRPIGTHLQAVALQDEELIREVFAGYGGWKWYFDEYLTDQGFYMEEFGKFYSNTGAMILWCEALDRLGLGEMGYDYVGQTGITMRSHLRANTLDLAYPAIDWGGGMPTFPIITMGDAKGGSLPNAPVHHTLITGYLPSGQGGNRWASAARMNGPMAKMLVPFWLEAAHNRWPEDGYDFFLAALRQPGEERYYPSLFFNLGPKDPSAIQPPRPTPSYLAKQRGFAFLRSDHSENYWMGPKPAVALQFSRYYVHYVHDPMTLIGYHAFNAPMILNGWGTGRGYAGGDAWRDSVRGHSGVVVDNQQAGPVARGFDGTEGHQYRKNLENDLDLRFVSVRADGTYPGVAQERSLFLGEHYLFDVTWLQNEDEEQPRRYEWQVISPLTGLTGEGWEKSADLDGLALYQGSRFEDRVRSAPPAPTQVRKMNPGAEPWQARLTYQAKGETMEEDPAFYHFAQRGLGMDVHLLGGEQTEVYLGVPPGARQDAPPSLLMARRDTPSTVFSALYVPFAGDQPVIQEFSRLASSDEGVAVLIRGTGPDGVDFEDIIMLAIGDAVGEEITLSGDHGFRARFTDHAAVRQSGDDPRKVMGQLNELVSGR